MLGKSFPFINRCIPIFLQKISFLSGSQSLSGKSRVQTTLNFGFRVHLRSAISNLARDLRVLAVNFFRMRGADAAAEGCVTLMPARN